MKTLTNISMLGICVVVGLTLLTLRAGQNVYEQALIHTEEIKKEISLYFNPPAGQSFSIPIQRGPENTWKLVGHSGNLKRCSVSDKTFSDVGSKVKQYKTVFTCTAVDAGEAWLKLEHIDKGGYSAGGDIPFVTITFEIEEK